MSNHQSTLTVINKNKLEINYNFYKPTNSLCFQLITEGKTQSSNSANLPSPVCTTFLVMFSKVLQSSNFSPTVHTIVTFSPSKAMLP